MNPTLKVFQSWSKDSTQYSVLIVDGDETFLKEYGGQYLTVVMVGNRGRSYFLNLGYLDASYVAEKFGLGLKDSENVAEKLNMFFEK